MRALMVAVLCVTSVACTCDITPCTTNDQCGAGNECVEGFCAKKSDGGTVGGGTGGGTVGGGTGGGTMGGGGGGGGTMGGGGGTTGGGTGGGGTGGGGGMNAFCDLSIINACAPYEECEPSVTGGSCVSSQLTVTWLTPDGGAVFRTSPVLATLAVTKADGGTVSLTRVPVTNAGSFIGSAGTYSGDLDLFAPDGLKTFTAGWEDAGLPFAKLTIRRDATSPDFSVAVVNAPTYGADDGGFLLIDPMDSRTGPLPLVKKDETVTVEVTSTSSDVSASTLSLHLRAGPAVWDAGQPANCTSSPAAFCRVYTVALGPQPMNAFGEDVVADVTGEDQAQNPGFLADAGVMRVTRWKWARLATTLEFKAAPAISSQTGDVFVGARGTGGGVFKVTPAGFATQENSAGSIEAGLAIGKYNTGEEAVFFMTTNNFGLQALDGGPSCGAASSTNVGSLAIINDGAAITNNLAPMMGVGVVGLTATRQVSGLRAGVACPANSIEPTGVPSMAYPGNIVISGNDLWYPAANGDVRRFSLVSTVFDAGTTLSGLGTGTIYGLSLFGGGATLTGGGGAGVSRLFVTASDGGTPSVYSSGGHVSGVAVGAGNALYAVTADMSEVGTLRRFDSAGVAQDAVPSTATLAFPAASVPGATTPVLGNGGWVYATGNNGTVIAADQSNLDVSWTKALAPTIGGEVLASPTLDCNRTKPGSGTGIHYFATTSGWVVAYITESPGLDVTAPWPKYQHDARNTGRVGASVACP